MVEQGCYRKEKKTGYRYTLGGHGHGLELKEARSEGDRHTDGRVLVGGLSEGSDLDLELEAVSASAGN
jgi:hypothetical protein